MATADRWEKFRPLPVYLLMAVLPVSLALVGIAKLLILLMAIAFLTTRAGRQQFSSCVGRLPVMLALALALAAFTLSLLWTEAPLPQALAALVKHAKLALMLFVVLLLPTREQAVRALVVLLVMQGLVLLCAYLLCLGVDLPWVQDNERLSLGTVFSSYLDQSLMTVGLGLMTWHFRDDLGLGRWPWAVPLACALAALNVLLFLPGRTGQFALAVAAVISLYRALPVGRRWLAVAIPVLAIAGVNLLSAEFRARAALVQTEVENYLAGDRNPASSAGTRLNFWTRSLEGIAEQPLAGHGVGSWGSVYRRLEGSQLRPEFAELRNPHQEFLLWGVELGAGGVLLMAGMFLALLRAASGLSEAARNATTPFLGVMVASCLLNCSLYDALIGDYFCACLGLLLAAGTSPRPESSS